MSVVMNQGVQPQGQVPVQPQGQVPVQPQGQVPVQPVVAPVAPPAVPWTQEQLAAEHARLVTAEGEIRDAAAQLRAALEGGPEAFEALRASAGITSAPRSQPEPPSSPSTAPQFDDPDMARMAQYFTGYVDTAVGGLGTQVGMIAKTFEQMQTVAENGAIRNAYPAVSEEALAFAAQIRQIAPNVDLSKVVGRLAALETGAVSRLAPPPPPPGQQLLQGQQPLNLQPGGYQDPNALQAPRIQVRHQPGGMLQRPGMPVAPQSLTPPARPAVGSTAHKAMRAELYHRLLDAEQQRG